MEQRPIDPVTAPDQKKGRGCFFWGCASLLVIMAVVVTGIFLTSIYVYKTKIRPLVSDYTSTQSVTLPVVELSEGELTDARQRLENFQEAARSHQQTSIELTAREINGLINSNPEFREAKGKIYVTLDNDRIGGEVSMPLDAFFLRGHYLNGRVVLGVTTDQNGLRVTIEHLELNGKTASPEVIEQLRSTNLAEHTSKDPQVRELITRIREVAVNNGVLKITLR